MNAGFNQYKFLESCWPQSVWCGWEPELATHPQAAGVCALVWLAPISRAKPVGPLARAVNSLAHDDRHLGSVVALETCLACLQIRRPSNGCRQSALWLVTEMVEYGFMKQVSGCPSWSVPAAAWFDS